MRRRRAITTIMVIVIATQLAVIIITTVRIIAPTIVAGADKPDLKRGITLGVSITGRPSRVSARISIGTIFGAGGKEGPGEKAGRKHQNLFHHICSTLGKGFKFDQYYFIPPSHCKSVA